MGKLMAYGEEISSSSNNANNISFDASTSDLTSKNVNDAILEVYEDVKSGGGGGGTATNIGVVLLNDKWTLNSKTNMYENKVNVDGMTSNSFPKWGLVPSNGVIDDYEVDIYNHLNLYTYTDYVVFTSDTKPDRSITVVITNDVMAGGDSTLADLSAVIQKVNVVDTLDGKINKNESDISTLNDCLAGGKVKFRINEKGELEYSVYTEEV